MESKDEKTVLMDQLDRACNHHQTTDSLNTQMLCTYELEYFWYGIQEDQRSTLCRDNLERFINYISECKVSDANSVSAEARREYEYIQTLNFNCPSTFKVKYWLSLSEKQQSSALESALEKLQQAMNDTGETPGTRVRSEATGTSPLKTPEHVTRINIVNQRVENEPKQQTEEPSAERITTSTGSMEPSSNQRYTSPPSRDQASAEKATSQQQGEPKSNHEATSQHSTDLSGTPGAGSCGNSRTPVSERGSDEFPNDVRSTEATGNKLHEIPDNASGHLSLDPRSSREQIAGQFMKIYKDRYRTVFESISKRNIPKEDIFDELLSLVLIVSEECRSFAKDQIHSMQNYCITIMDSSYGENTKHAEIRKDEELFPLFEFRRQNAQLSFDMLFKRSLTRFREREKIQYDHLPTETTNQLDQFLSGCVSVIWYMTIQETPLVLEHDERSEADVTRLFYGSNDTHRRLRKVIWPAVRVCKGGPVIERGVAEFTK